LGDVFFGPSAKRQEPERHRKLQTLAQEDKYLPVVIIGKLNQLSLGLEIVGGESWIKKLP